jgi:sodium transport system permease protein
MLKTVWTVASKEALDHLRDARGLASATLFTLMGPLVVWLVLFALGSGDSSGSGGNEAGARILPAMASVFVLVAAFSGSLSMTMDLIAGERERRSLLPLLMNSVSRFEIIVGKWLAASMFAVGGLFANLLAFAAVFAFASATPSTAASSLLMMAPALVTLALAAAALQIVVSTMCRNVKEANTYLSMLIFVVMGVGMWLAFRPQSAEGWWFLAPIAGQQVLMQLGLVTGELPVLKSWLLAAMTAASTVLVLFYAGRLMRRDGIIYGE